VTFEWPLVLIALVLVPVVIALYVLRERRRDDYAARFTTPTLLPNLVAAAPGWRRHLPLALLLVGLSALSWASPVRTRAWTSAARRRP
jgi:hypothetical protein